MTMNDNRQAVKAMAPVVNNHLSQVGGRKGVKSVANV